MTPRCVISVWNKTGKPEHGKCFKYVSCFAQNCVWSLQYGVEFMPKSSSSYEVVNRNHTFYIFTHKLTLLVGYVFPEKLINQQLYLTQNKQGYSSNPIMNNAVW